MTKQDILLYIVEHKGDCDKRGKKNFSCKNCPLVEIITSTIVPEGKCRYRAGKGISEKVVRENRYTSAAKMYLDEGGDKRDLVAVLI